MHFGKDSDDIQRKFKEDPLYKEMLRDLKEILPRFSPDSRFSETGKGELKSDGVDALKKIKESGKKKKSNE